MNWYKIAQFNNSNDFRDKLFNIITENVPGNWTPGKFNYYKGGHISASISGTSQNSVGTRTGFFDIRLTIFLVNDVINYIICSTYGTEFTGKFPETNWMTQRMFRNEYKEMQDISQDTLHSIEEIPGSVQNAINKFFSDDERNPDTELNPNNNPIIEKEHELV